MINIFNNIASNKKINLPSGIHKIDPLFASERYIFVTNNDSGLKRIALLIENKENIIIDGRDSKWLFYDKIVPIVIKNSQNIILKNFNIDWNKPFFFQGEVININNEDNYFDLKVYDECTYYISDSRLYFMGINTLDEKMWKSWSDPTNDKKTWIQNVQWSMWFDSKTKAPVFNEMQYAVKTDPIVKELKPGIIRFYDATKKMPKVGMTLVLKGKRDPNRNYPAIILIESNNINIENVNIYHAGGMGLVAQRCENINLVRFNVKLPPNSKRLCSATADATHFNGCKGKITLDNCLFENMLDDSLNVHGTYVKVIKVINKKSMYVRLMHSQQVGLKFAEANDILRVYQCDSLDLKFRFTVKNIEHINSEIMLITTEKDLPSILQEGMIIDNESWQPEVHIKNCLVRNNRARSLLLQSGKKILIENNTFESSSMQGFRFDGDGNFWYEAGSVNEVLIINNVFKNIMSYIIEAGPKVNCDLYPNVRYHKNIKFENNYIKTFHNKLLNLRAVDNFCFNNNIIELTNENDKNKSISFNFVGSSNVKLIDNRYINFPKISCKSDKNCNCIDIKEKNIKFEME